ncbi:endolytic transglycosylase MltG [Nordella sp. HKS 07]|uniref:endolytic transglycosylase MltG n=1 Tax=Nordella sp. HKS 07 TaxID=2712222 RepID=UPI0013E1D8FD|nr:endolytic transglycosylase MltG [Nordella sp. HKS 07]QIG50683.1 endolytic transglycosylase MltG [Nordella sp. HKS 07]
MAFAAALYGYMKFTQPGPLAADTVFQIERGSGIFDIAAELEKAGVISDANIFAAAAKLSRLTGAGAHLKPGEYQFKQAMSMRDAMKLITSGKFIVYKVTIPEGWTTAQTLDRLRGNEVLLGDITLTPGEGQLMPDTYVFQRGETRDNIVKGMMQAHQKLVDELWPQRAEDTPVKTPAEAIVLASIIEKETGQPEERSRVASVFANRLRLGMRLQSDPTIIYGITGGKTKFDRSLTKKDIAEATPYNTYRINGLPPGPIANPGRASLQAALSPAKTKDLYFVADGSGGHAFAETLEEHRANVKKWREIEKKRNQGGEEAPVMDETQEPGEPAAVPAETAAVAQPGPEAAPVEQQTPKPSLPTGDDIQTSDQQGADNQAPEPETDVEAAAPATPTDTASQAPEQGAAAVPLPRPKPERLIEEAPTAPAEAPTTVADATLNLKPGSVIRGAKGLIPIPAPKPQMP